MIAKKHWSLRNAGLALMAGFLAYSVIGQLIYAARAPFHFDELNEMSRLFSAETGRVMSALRSGFHYLFIPVGWLDISEDRLMILLRQLNFALFVIPSLIFSGLIVYHIRRNLFLSLLAPAMIMAAETYYSVVHQYRTDQFSVLVFLYLLWLFLRTNLQNKTIRFYTVPGLLMGLCFFHNPKSLYFFIALAAFISLKEDWTPGLIPALRKLVPKGIYFGVFTAVVFIGLTLLHMHHYDLDFTQLNRQAERAAQTGLGHIAEGGSTTGYVREFYQNNLILFNGVFILIGVALVRFVRAIRSNSVVHSADILILTMLVVLGTFYLHRGVYSYYAIIFMLIIGTGFAVGSDFIWRGLDRPVATAVVFICALTFFQMYDALDLKGREKLRFQRSVMRSLNDAFPSVKTYADGANLMARKHNVLNLFTVKKRALYKAEALGDFRDLYKDKRPEFILHTSKFAVHDYHPKDFAYLRNNYARISEYLWVPGRRFHEPVQGLPVKQRFRLGGIYRLDPDNPKTKVQIDGQDLTGTLKLRKGPHEIICLEHCEPFKIYRANQDLLSGDLVLKIYPSEKKEIELKRKKNYRLVNFRDPAAVRAATELLVNGKKAARRKGRHVHMKAPKGKVILENKSDTVLLFDIFVSPVGSA